jgi:hypothetical protein
MGLRGEVASVEPLGSHCSCSRGAMDSPVTLTKAEAASSLALSWPLLCLPHLARFRSGALETKPARQC